MSGNALESARALLASAVLDPAAENGADPLAALLYQRWFHAMDGVPRVFPDAPAFRAVALAARPFESGWTLEEPLAGAPGSVRARRGAELRDAPPLAWAPEHARRARAWPGEALLLAPLREGPAAGFWHVWSPAWPARAPQRLRRWYLQPRADAELALAAALSAAAPPSRAWAAKLLCGAHPAGRRDGGVFYAPVRGAAWLDALFAALAPYLADAPPPPFAEPVAPGLAWADDPGGGLSFGQHRSGLLAAAARAEPEALADAAPWRAAVARAFAAAGLSLDAPARGREQAGDG
jgi:hypothetical protein